MSHFRTYIKAQGESDFKEVTKDVIDMGRFREFNDESSFFSGVFRRGNFEITLNNNSNIYTRGESFFPNQRENSEVEIYYKPNNEEIDDILVFRGVITEGSTQNDLTSRNLKLTLVDSLKLIRDITLEASDMARIDSLYKTLRSSNIKLDKHYLACFLYYVINSNSLHDTFNVFEGGVLNSSSYPSINTTIESLFSPSNSFYSVTNASALDIFNDLLRSLNSYSVLEHFSSSSKLFIKARPIVSLNDPKETKWDTIDLLRLENQTDGFNKVYNSISINGSDPYTNMASILRYGSRQLSISSHIPASSFIGETYLSYYKDPKQEIDAVFRVRAETLDLKIGDVISLDVEDLQEDFTIQPFSSTMYIINREIDFKQEVLTLRLREI